MHLKHAVAPDPIEIMICLYGLFVQSPAANTPGMFVAPRLSTTISPNRLRSTVSPNQSVFGTRPI